jgi:dihydrofolate reductase
MEQKKPRISMVVAVDDKRAIGKDNGLLWRIPRDVKRFVTLTTGHAIIMGRKTYESIGKALPNRTNIVITRDENFSAPDIIVAHSLNSALEKAKEIEQEEIQIIGGGQIYEEALPLTDRLYLTHVHGDFQGTVFFPSYEEFNQELEHENFEEDEYKFTFLTLEKN